jgi:hypothetical protein
MVPVVAVVSPAAVARVMMVATVVGMGMVRFDDAATHRRDGDRHGNEKQAALHDASPGRAGFAPARTLPRRHGAGQSKTRRRGVVDRPPLMEIGRFRQEADRRLNSRAWRLKSASPA